MEIDFNLSGLDAIERDIKTVTSSELTVGLHSDSGHYPGVKGKQGLSLVDVYMINAYGLAPNMAPPRPFMDITLMLYGDKIERGMLEVLDGAITGNPTSSLVAIGKYATKCMYDVVYSKQYLQPNAPKTIKEKGFDWPMVRTHQMIESLNYKIRPNSDG